MSGTYCCVFCIKCLRCKRRQHARTVEGHDGALHDGHISGQQVRTVEGHDGALHKGHISVRPKLHGACAAYETDAQLGAVDDARRAEVGPECSGLR